MSCIPVGISFPVKAMHRVVLDLDHANDAIPTDHCECIVVKRVRRNSRDVGVKLRHAAQQEPLPAVQQHALVAAANADVTPCGI